MIKQIRIGNGLKANKNKITDTNILVKNTSNVCGRQEFVLKRFTIRGTLLKICEEQSGSAEHSLDIIAVW